MVREAHLRGLIRARGLHILHGRTIALSTLVYTFCRHNDTQPEDKVYGLLGLNSDSQTPELQPDYYLSIWEIYARLTAHK